MIDGSEGYNDKIHKMKLWIYFSKSVFFNESLNLRI